MQPGGGSGGSNEGAMKSPPPQRRLVVRISCTLPALRYALTKNPVRSGITM